MWHATAIGFMANNLLPARAGEVARAYAARRLSAVRFSTAFASIAVERVLDGLVMVVFLTVAIWDGEFSPETTVGGVRLVVVARGAGILFAAALAVALAAVHWPGPALRVSGALAHHVLPPRAATWSVETLGGLLSGLEGLREPGRFVPIVFWSFALWLVMAASFWVGFLAFGIELPWSAALLLQALIAFGVAVPAAPGFFGLFEAVTRATLSLYGVAAGSAVAYALGYHLATFLPITLLGMWSLSRAHLHLAELKREPADANERTSAPES